MRTRITKLKEDYENLCLNLAGLDSKKEDELRNLGAGVQTMGGRTSEQSSLIILQATHPEKNASFVREGILV